MYREQAGFFCTAETLVKLIFTLKERLWFSFCCTKNILIFIVDDVYEDRSSGIVLSDIFLRFGKVDELSKLIRGDFFLTIINIIELMKNNNLPKEALLKEIERYF